MSEEKKIIASESHHWYSQDGTPAYTIVGKNGKERPTTLRDARKLDLVPSVTTIMQVMAKPGLEMWKLNQVLLSSMTLPMLEDESADDYAKRVIADYQDEGKKARDRGTIIHGAIERGFLGLPIEPDYQPHYLAAREELDGWTGGSEYSAEKSFAAFGYGGKVDIHCPGFVCDFKSTDKPLEKLKAWDEHAMQLAAYRKGLGMSWARCAIIYIHVDGTTKLIELTEDELEIGLDMFNACFDLWKAAKKYIPECV